jgi:hypothetical protein
MFTGVSYGQLGNCDDMWYTSGGGGGWRRTLPTQAIDRTTMINAVEKEQRHVKPT